MLKLLFQLICLVILGLLAYDISQTGSFPKSHMYNYVKDARVVSYGELMLKEVKKTFNKAFNWSENFPVYYNQICTNLKLYMNVSDDLSLVLKSNAQSFVANTATYIEKNFPAFQDSVSVILADTVTVAKKSLIIIFDHLHNNTVSAVQHAKNMFELEQQLIMT